MTFITIWKVNENQVPYILYNESWTISHKVNLLNQTEYFSFFKEYFLILQLRLGNFVWCLWYAFFSSFHEVIGDCRWNLIQINEDIGRNRINFHICILFTNKILIFTATPNKSKRSIILECGTMSYVFL